VQSNLYVGYDSAGQHVAAAAGVPLVSVFAGHACDRMFSRWCPTGPATRVVVVDQDTRRTAFDRTLKAIAEAVAAPRAATTG